MTTSGELRAKVQSTGGWGQVANDQQLRYVLKEPDGRRRRRRCRQGDVPCPGFATHRGCANGLALTGGCEWHMRQWARS